MNSPLQAGCRLGNSRPTKADVLASIRATVLFTDGWRTKRIDNEPCLGRGRVSRPQLLTSCLQACQQVAAAPNYRRHANISRMDRDVCCNWCTAATARGPAQTAGTRAGATARTDDGKSNRHDLGRARARGLRRVARANRADHSRVVASARGRGGARLWVRGSALRRAPLRGRCCLHLDLCVVRPSGKCHRRGGRRPDPAGAVGGDRACLCRNKNVTAPSRAG